MSIMIYTTHIFVYDMSKTKFKNLDGQCPLSSAPGGGGRGGVTVELVEGEGGLGREKESCWWRGRGGGGAMAYIVA